ncbi:predicted protein [Plenodomus lingam JN3]|uniref:Predicted protein n=1 Tax=Leptosphaeria maculans (strain JN3 / isolate v23.1.3 / race Av1-4-5-6-7-8) TaxID=985895 RepID=E4ZSM6_LEPMJ|nr:predicted protein [Plenodomus lingam JN3]CBX94406.1 predicted protein [Plenodomus lingam JN3]
MYALINLRQRSRSPQLPFESTSNQPTNPALPTVSGCRFTGFTDTGNWSIRKYCNICRALCPSFGAWGTLSLPDLTRQGQTFFDVCLRIEYRR